MISALLVALAIPAEPLIVSREAWGAKDRLPGASPHVIRHITIHHTGVKSVAERSLEDKLRGLQAFSQRVDMLASGKEKPAWVDVPYHYYISIDGRIGEGREWFFSGDTNTEYDPSGHLLIVVDGEFEIEKVTDSEWNSLVDLTTYLAFKFRVPVSEIKSHRDYSAQTTCPGKDLYARLDELRSGVSARLGR